MKVLHLPFTYYSDAVGGTEVYVTALAEALRLLGIDSIIAAPAESNALYEHHGLKVYRFALSAVDDPSEIYGIGDRQGAAAAARILDTETPDVVHMHALTRGVSLLVLREAKKRKIPVVFTYHTPTVSCPRGTLLYWGHQVCDGRLKIRRCTACKLQSFDLPPTAAHVLSYIPRIVGDTITVMGQSGGVWTALRMSQLIAQRQAMVQAVWKEVDAIIALNAWTRNLLVNNSVNPEKIHIVRHGLGEIDNNLPVVVASPQAEEPLRLVFLGRFSPEKGLDLVIDAIRSMAEANIILDAYGIRQEGSDALASRLAEQAAHDSRIRLLPAIPQSEVINRLTQYHALVIPSRCLETGPLVLLEAFAAGIPVLGANLGGIAEWVQHEVNGLLIAPNSVSAWCETLTKLLRYTTLLDNFRTMIKNPPTMLSAAEQILNIYLTIAHSAVHSSRS